CIYVAVAPSLAQSYLRYYLMNCSLPTMPILVTPRRCADAITAATDLYGTSLLGRRCTSAWVGIAATPCSFASSWLRSGTTAPFHSTVPSKSTSMVMTSGGTNCGGGAPVGMFRLTAWFWIGIVMISMMMSTSITSISGVMFISIIGSGSAALPPLELTFMPMVIPCLNHRAH